MNESSQLLSVNSPESLLQKIQKVKALLDESQVCFDMAFDLYSSINFSDFEYEYNLCQISFIEHEIYIMEKTVSEFFDSSFDNLKFNQIFNENKLSNNFVYLAKQKNEKNIYKIGRTIDLDTRERTFKVGNLFVDLIAYRIVNDSVKAEKYLHNLFSSKHISGEWFELTDQDIDLLIKTFGFNYGLEG